MSIGYILMIGVVLLVSGCGGLLLVRLDNPRLLGLGWLGAALAMGGSGAILLLSDAGRFPLLAILLSDLLVLGSMVLLHYAVMEVVGVRGVPRFSLLLLVLQAVADLLKIYGPSLLHLRIAAVGILIGLQASYTVLVLWRNATRSIRAPARLISLVLGAFIMWNFLRSLLTLTGVLTKRGLESQVQAMTDVIFLAVALGLAFGFFWMTTSNLSAMLEGLASTDPLTGLLNRRSFTRCLEEELRRAERLSDSFSLLMLDLDHFKRVNDEHGHAAGDEVLCGAAQNIQDAVRGIDVVGRWGGEEFVVLLPGAKLEAAGIVARRILANIQRASPLRDKSRHIPVTGSIGLAVHAADDAMEAILERADRALYRAKAEGRNCVRVGEEGLSAGVGGGLGKHGMGAALLATEALDVVEAGTF
jgi:diguanylate cyclase (GGDEF)-like protein